MDGDTPHTRAIANRTLTTSVAGFYYSIPSLGPLLGRYQQRERPCTSSKAHKKKMNVHGGGYYSETKKCGGYYSETKQ